jgi:hypothetical protein
LIFLLSSPQFGAQIAATMLAYASSPTIAGDGGAATYGNSKNEPSPVRKSQPDSRN